MQGSSVLFSHTKDDWETPQDFFNELKLEFNLTLDVASSLDNHKCEDFITETSLYDALDERCSWKSSGTAFVNPPYSKWQKFVKKAFKEWHKGNPIVMLLPARTDTKAFHAYIWDDEKNCPKEGIEVRFLKGRLKFEIYGKPLLDKRGHPQPAPFPSMVVIFKGKCFDS